MGTKLIRLIFCCYFSSMLNVFSQQGRYDDVLVESISIRGFKYGYNMQKCKELFGNPSNYKEYKDPYPVEGYGTTFYINYDSLNFTYAEYYKEVILCNLAVSGRRYKVKIGEVTISVGDSIDKLNSFKNSYQTYLKNASEKKQRDEDLFYINIIIKKLKYTSNGLITIKILKNAISQIYFRFDEST